MKVVLFYVCIFFHKLSLPVHCNCYMSEVHVSLLQHYPALSAYSVTQYIHNKLFTHMRHFYHPNIYLTVKVSYAQMKPIEEKPSYSGVIKSPSSSWSSGSLSRPRYSRLMRSTSNLSGRYSSCIRLAVSSDLLRDSSACFITFSICKKCQMIKFRSPQVGSGIVECAPVDSQMPYA